MPRHKSAPSSPSKIGVVGNLALFAIVLAALTISSFLWPAFWTELVKEESLILGVVGDLLDLRQLVGISVAITFAVSLMRRETATASDLVIPAGGVLAGVAIAGGGWGASLGLAAIAVAALVRPVLAPPEGDEVD